MSHAPQHNGASGLAAQVHEATGENVATCYQCGKCAAGCPLGTEMDVPSTQILRLLQSGLPGTEDEVLGALSIWLCLACETCATRCPQEVDLPKIMDFLRQEALARGQAHHASRDIVAFHQSFLDSVRKNGRLHEVGLVSSYKLRTGHLFQDVLLAPLMFLRGKLSLLPHKIPGQDAVARIFAKCAQPDEKK